MPVKTANLCDNPHPGKTNPAFAKAHDLGSWTLRKYRNLGGIERRLARTESLERIRDTQNRFRRP